MPERGWQTETTILWLRQ